MKTLLLILTLVGSAHAQKLELILPFTTNSTVTVERHTNGDLYRVETGHLNGVPYRIYSDGSAKFAGRRDAPLESLDPDKYWRVRCSRDAMTDRITCFMFIQDLMVGVDNAGRRTVGIGTQHFPKSTIAIRFDQGVSISSKGQEVFTFTESEKVITGLAAAKRVTTRYREWPSGHNVDRSWDLYGFNEALSYITWAVERIRVRA